MRFLLYDRILDLEPGKRILAVKMVTLADEFLGEHYPRRAIMPPTLVLEALAQAAGWLHLVTQNFNIRMVLALVEGVTYTRPVVPGDELRLEAWTLYTHGGGVTARAEARVGGDLVAAVERLVLAHEEVDDDDFVMQQRERFRYVSGGFVLPEGEVR
ncbi:MAG: beta-hydroxyacyl-ACP dehydratase [Chloroflexota bacterium]|nr:beta-hydroxyacyl-ACP dehydratase [Chloroflexota bacterium]